ncbi:hypothetical protein HDE_07378 [Halotydeus destructor]|nr:hypothetical protein HDE_07378 [Halotydeus destructor]
MASTNDDYSCKGCRDKLKKLKEQQDKLELVQKRFREVVTACKQAHEKLQEKDDLLRRKDQLLIEASVAVTSGNSEEHQKRIAALESSIAELSRLCGEYESQRAMDKKTMDQLKSDLAQVQISNPVVGLNHIDAFKEKIEKVVLMRSRAIQTEVEVETIDDAPVQDVGVQTEAELSVQPGAKLAIVIPTPRSESEQETRHLNTNADDASNESPSDTSPALPLTPRSPDGGNGHDFSRSRLSDSASFLGQQPPNSVSLFYANELARKDIELAEARLQAREYECALREVQWKYNVEKYRLQTRLAMLEKQQQAVQKQGASQPNLTYIKNVLTQFNSTKDKNQRQIMMNALLTALHASESLQQ